MSYFSTCYFGSLPYKTMFQWMYTIRENENCQVLSGRFCNFPLIFLEHANNTCSCSFVTVDPPWAATTVLCCECQHRRKSCIWSG